MVQRAQTAKERPEAVRQYLRELPPAQAARLVGSRERLTAVLNSADWEQVTQAGVRLEYRLRRLGELGVEESLYTQEASPRPWKTYPCCRTHARSFNGQ